MIGMHCGMHVEAEASLLDGAGSLLPPWIPWTFRPAASAFYPLRHLASLGWFLFVWLVDFGFLNLLLNCKGDIMMAPS